MTYKIQSTLLAFLKFQHRLTVKPSKENSFPSSSFSIRLSMKGGTHTRFFICFFQRKCLTYRKRVNSHVSFLSDRVVRRCRDSCRDSCRDFFFFFLENYLFLIFCFWFSRWWFVYMKSMLKSKRGANIYVSHNKYALNGRKNREGINGIFL